MTRTLTSAMGIALSATLLFAAPMAANAAETDTAATAGFMTAWKAYAGNGATLAATAEPVLADSIETGSIASTATLSTASSGVGSAAATAAGFAD